MRDKRWKSDENKSEYPPISILKSSLREKRKRRPKHCSPSMLLPLFSSSSCKINIKFIVFAFDFYLLSLLTRKTDKRTEWKKWIETEKPYHSASRNSEKNKIKQNNSSEHTDIVRKSKLMLIFDCIVSQWTITNSFTIWLRSNGLFIHTAYQSNYRTLYNSGNVNKWNNIDIVTNNTELKERGKNSERKKVSKTSYPGGCCALRRLCHANLVFYRAKWDTISWVLHANRADLQIENEHCRASRPCHRNDIW